VGKGRSKNNHDGTCKTRGEPGQTAVQHSQWTEQCTNNRHQSWRRGGHKYRSAGDHSRQSEHACQKESDPENLNKQRGKGLKKMVDHNYKRGGRTERRETHGPPTGDEQQKAQEVKEQQ